MPRLSSDREQGGICRAAARQRRLAAPAGVDVPLAEKSAGAAARVDRTEQRALGPGCRSADGVSHDTQMRGAQPMINPKRFLGIFTAVVLVLVLVSCRRGAGDSQAHLRDSAAVTTGDTAQTLQPIVSLLSYEQREGRDLFLKYCSVCHGDQGKGDGFNAFNLDPKPRNLADDKYMHTLAYDRIAQTIREGG